jgi:NADPH:quinone reductase-like Zn-dependent oxidoreductase
VIACFAPHWHDGDPEIDFIRSTIGGPEDGNLSEYSVFHESGVVKTPDFLSDAEAATIPCAGLTAYNALVYLGNLKPGNTVVILGTGGVSLFALQIAKMMGCQVIITSRSEEKLKKALLLGADQGILTSQKANWDREIRKLTSMKGADFVLEVGGAGTLPKSIQSVRPGGVVALIGVLAGGESKDLSLYPVLMQGIRIQGVIVGNTSMLRSFCHALESNKIKPVLDEEFSWTKTKEALEYLSLGKHFGKIPIKID